MDGWEIAGRGDLSSWLLVWRNFEQVKSSLNLAKRPGQNHLSGFLRQSVAVYFMHAAILIA
jgi:hypothetical protein